METGPDERDPVSLLRQAHDRSRRLAEDLSRHRLELEKPCRSVPGPLVAEGQAAVRGAADAAAALRECLAECVAEVLRQPHPTSPPTPTDQGCT